MERFNSKLYENYTNLKRCKFSSIEENNQKIISNVLQYQSATEQLIEDLKNENDRLRVKLMSTEEQYRECKKFLLGEKQKTKMLDNELGTLKELLDKSLQRSSCRSTVIRLEDSDELLLEKKKSDTLSGQNTILNKKHTALTPHEGCIQDSLMPDCCHKIREDSGDRILKNCSPCAFHMLVELLVGMNFVVDYQSEGPHFSVFHQMSGYSFTLTWVRDRDGGEGQLAYHVSSLGSIERIALDWMKEDIVFNLSMCPVFFDRLARVVGKK